MFAMKPPVIIAGIVLIIVISVGGIMALLGPAGGAAAYDTMTGQQLYTKLCFQCHGAKGTGGSGGGSSYAGKRDFWDEQSIIAYLANPQKYRNKQPHMKDSKKFMPAISPSVPIAARKKIAQHVLGLMDKVK